MLLKQLENIRVSYCYEAIAKRVNQRTFVFAQGSPERATSRTNVTPSRSARGMMIGPWLISSSSVPIQ